MRTARIIIDVDLPDDAPATAGDVAEEVSRALDFALDKPDAEWTPALALGTYRVRGGEKLESFEKHLEDLLGPASATDAAIRKANAALDLVEREGVATPELDSELVRAEVTVARASLAHLDAAYGREVPPAGVTPASVSDPRYVVEAGLEPGVRRNRVTGELGYSSAWLGDQVPA